MIEAPNEASAEGTRMEAPPAVPMGWSLGWVSAERMLMGRKHFSQCVMVSVAVSKLDKTELVFVQPGAKTNSVYYCENVGYSNKVYCRQFAVSRTTTLCSSRTERLHTVHTTLSLYLRSNALEFIEPENWPPNSLDLNRSKSR